MTASGDDRVRFLGWALYPLALLLILGPAIQVALTVWPPRIEDLNWRFAVVGFYSDALIVPVLGVFLAVIAANLLEQRFLQISMASVVGVLAAVMGVILVLFLLDALQLQSRIGEEARWAFMGQTLRSALVQVLAALFFGVLSVAGFRLWQAGRGRGSGVRRRRDLAIQARSPIEG